ncbi:hypothetical protein BFN03_19875 [Rhodococcus sp. WMMA185]|nr:hypothetical protein BFN03_19875 [Rhodococcus sp. WMMA185]
MQLAVPAYAPDPSDGSVPELDMTIKMRELHCVATHCLGHRASAMASNPPGSRVGVDQNQSQRSATENTAHNSERHASTLRGNGI